MPRNSPASARGTGESHPVTFRADFVDGARAISPLLPPGATVSIVTGVAATAVGVTPVQAFAMSVIVYSPTVMLAAFELLDAGAPMAVVAAAALVVGVRFSMLSLSIAPYLTGLSRVRRWAVAYFLWTPTYALSVDRFEAEPGTSRSGFYLGTALPLWATFQVALVAGVWFGALVPAAWQLRFVVPLAFIALLMRFVARRPAKVAAVVAGTLAVVGAGFPLGAGLVVAAVGGTVAALAAERWGGG